MSKQRKSNATTPTREWVTFPDPVDEGRTWQIDVTFLLSSWTCIFGAGCQGVYDKPTPELGHGCCTYGAHFSDKADRDHVVKVAKKRDDEWQFAKLGRKKGIFKQVGKNDDGSPDWQTRVVHDACIFLNRDGFPNGDGCALHQYAMRTGVHHSSVKPEVCWQLPLRRVDDEQDDGTVISRLTEFGREGWGEGGDDFAWWCTESRGAFVGRSRCTCRWPPSSSGCSTPSSPSRWWPTWRRAGRPRRRCRSCPTRRPCRCGSRRSGSYR